VNVDAVGFFGTLIDVLWVLLAICVGILVLASVWVLARAISRRLEARYLPGVARWSRRRAGLAEDAGPWACPACSSVNSTTSAMCYHCGGPRVAEAHELSEAATDAAVFHRPAPESRFDPALYRGPGAPAASDPAATTGAAREDVTVGRAP
jgi:hypothetical protein